MSAPGPASGLVSGAAPDAAPSLLSGSAPAAPLEATALNPRLLWLDLLRGAAVALMILVNHPGNWNHLYPPLAHAPWHGWTPTDLVFPFFLFAVGNALALVMPALWAGTPAAFWRKWAWRTGLIFFIGLGLNAAPFVQWDASGALVAKPLDALRILGVLQRIALCWGAAALLLWWAGRRDPARALPRALLAICAGLIAYAVACTLLAQGPDAYSLAGYFGTALDRAVLGARHLYQGEGQPFDPEGLASTLPAIAQVLLGWCTGHLLMQAPRAAHGTRRLLPLAMLGAALFAAGLVWGDVLPINKKLWTPSYVLLTTGLALLTLCALARAFDRPAGSTKARNKPTLIARAVAAFGRNALFVFVLSGLLPRLLSLVRWVDAVNAQGQPIWITPLPWLQRTLFADLFADPRAGSLAYALAHLGLYAALALWLDARRLYIKI